FMTSGNHLVLSSDISFERSPSSSILALATLTKSSKVNSLLASMCREIVWRLLLRRPSSSVGFVPNAAQIDLSRATGLFETRGVEGRDRFVTRRDWAATIWSPEGARCLYNGFLDDAFRWAP